MPDKEEKINSELEKIEANLKAGSDNPALLYKKSVLFCEKGGYSFIQAKGGW